MMKKLVFNPFTGSFDLIQDLSGIQTNASDITDLTDNENLLVEISLGEYIKNYQEFIFQY